MSKQDYFKAIAAVYLVLERDDEVLLIQRANTGYYDGYYSLPAGHVEAGESLKNAVIREAMEEIGVIIRPEDLDLTHVMNRPDDPEHPADGTRLDFFFRATRWQDEPRNQEPHKCSELRWCNRRDLPDRVIPEVRQAIGHATSGTIESEYGWSPLSDD